MWALVVDLYLRLFGRPCFLNCLVCGYFYFSPLAKLLPKSLILSLKGAELTLEYLNIFSLLSWRSLATLSRHTNTLPSVGYPITFIKDRFLETGPGTDELIERRILVVLEPDSDESCIAYGV